jgi:hypothetical protein
VLVNAKPRQIVDHRVTMMFLLRIPSGIVAAILETIKKLGVTHPSGGECASQLV